MGGWVDERPFRACRGPVVGRGRQQSGGQEGPVPGPRRPGLGGGVHPALQHALAHPAQLRVVLCVVHRRGPGPGVGVEGLAIGGLARGVGHSGDNARKKI